MIGQRYWIKQCLQTYTKRPNRLNLDTFNELEEDEDWWEATQSKYSSQGWSNPV